MPQQGILRKKSISLEELAPKDIPKKQTPALQDITESLNNETNQQQQTPQEKNTSDKNVTQNATSDNSEKTGSVFEFDFSAIHHTNQSQNGLGSIQGQQAENKTPDSIDLKKLYQQSTMYNNPYGAYPMMMNGGFNPYMMGNIPQQTAYLQMNQGYPNQFNNGMVQMNPGMGNHSMMTNQLHYSSGVPMNMQQGYNPQMNMGGFPQGMNNMQQSQPNNFF